jgi:hypothetical protein
VGRELAGLRESFKAGLDVRAKTWLMCNRAVATTAAKTNHHAKETER